MGLEPRTTLEKIQNIIKVINYKALSFLPKSEKGSKPLSYCYHFLQEVGLKGMKICVKDLQGSGSGHDPLTVSYAVIGGWFFICYT